MSIVKFELKQEHISLVRNLQVKTEPEDITLIPKFYSPSPFSLGMGSNLYDDVYMIVFGVKEGVDLMDSDGLEYTDEEIATMDKLISEVPMALDIILYLGNPEPGLYKTKYHLRDWRKDA